jgi:SAM-dependent methyltransferase
MADLLAGFKAVQRAGWAHFAPLQAITTMPAADLVKFAGIRPGQRVLDVACGTGVVAITAARAGAAVTALDLTPELLAVGRNNARTAGVEIEWREGDVEALPFDAPTFDVVVSQFGHMFAPRPAVAVGEMLRVLKPGGTIAFSTWPPEHLVGRMFSLTARYMPPPPPGVSPPGEWGDEAIVRERLGAAAVRDVTFARGTATVPTLSVPHYRELLERTAGPVMKLVETLSTSAPDRLAAFRKEHDALAAEYFGDNCLRQQFLMTRATKN